MFQSNSFLNLAVPGSGAPNGSVPQANFCWLGDVEEITFMSFEGMRCWEKDN